jgi:imidazolonepropionase-like amidohydrolase
MPVVTLAITNVRVFDGERVLSRCDVVIDDGLIVGVAPDISLPSGVERVDGTDRTLLPGLFDAHAHVFDAAGLEQSLAFGVTTVLDMASMPARVNRLKSEDRLDRADLRSAGMLATAPGGHGTQYGVAIPTITSSDEAERFVEARVAEGSDYLKIIYDAGGAYDRTIPTIDVATLRGLVEAAHRRDLLAVVHIGTCDEARTAIENGADAIVHLFRDRAPAPDFGALVAARRAFVTPTLTVLRLHQSGAPCIADDPAVAPYLGPDALATLREVWVGTRRSTPGAIETAIAQLRDAGAPILCGTDAPNAGTTYGASVHDELALLVDAGLSPVAALAAATVVPAREFALNDRGMIAVGLRADLVMVDGDPTTTISETRRIAAIWRGGKLFDRVAYQNRIAAGADPTSPIVFRCGCH